LPVAPVTPSSPARQPDNPSRNSRRRSRCRSRWLTRQKHAGYKLVNKDGEKLYCRTDPITGSRLQTKTQCLTEQELYDQMHQTQNAMSLATQQQSQTFRGN